MSAFASVTTPPAVPTWVLSGPKGSDLDTLVAMAVHSGCVAELMADGYRLTGPESFLGMYAKQIGKVEGYSLTDEQPRQSVVIARASVAPARPFRRTTHLEGAATYLVARAIDRSLQVTPAGVHRWAVTGTTAEQVAWWSEARGISVDEARQQWGLTPEQAAREDAELSIPAPVVNIDVPPFPSTLTIDKMPTRRTTQDITRRDGEIVEVVSIERDAP